MAERALCAYLGWYEGGTQRVRKKHKVHTVAVFYSKPLAKIRPLQNLQYIIFTKALKYL